MLNAEFIALTKGFKLDLEKTLEVIHGTTATNGQLKLNYTSKVFKDDLKPGFEINLAHKGLGIRSKRYAMLVEKGKIIKISEEEIAGKCEATAAENFLKDI